MFSNLFVLEYIIKKGSSTAKFSNQRSSYSTQTSALFNIMLYGWWIAFTKYFEPLIDESRFYKVHEARPKDFAIQNARPFS